MFATINLSPKITTKNLNGKTKKNPENSQMRNFREIYSTFKRNSTVSLRLHFAPHRFYTNLCTEPDAPSDHNNGSRGV